MKGFVGSLKRSFERALVLTANSQVQDGAPPPLGAHVFDKQCWGSQLAGRPERR